MRHIKRFNEVIKVDIKVGDTVLGGRFKNKKTVVKKIGKNKKGDITINGKPLLKFRIIKESLMDEVEDHFSYLEDDGFIVKVHDTDPVALRKGQGRIASNVMIFKSDGSERYSDMEEFSFDIIRDDLSRFLSMLERDDLSYIYYVVRNYYKDGGEKNDLIKITEEQVNDDDFELGNIIKLVIGFEK